MDNAKTGKLIYRLRKEKQMTQLQLAQVLNISDKTVSKWERGLGCPELSLLPGLARVFGVDIERLLAGEMEQKNHHSANMKKTIFYVCPECGNIVTALADLHLSCCGKKLHSLVPQQPDRDHKINMEATDGDYYITSLHPMEKDHYISFVALVTADSVTVKKRYPQWALQWRLPFLARGRLVWYCTGHGLYSMDI